MSTSRACWSLAQPIDHGWIAALRDPVLAPAMAAIHAEPGKPDECRIDLDAREACDPTKVFVDYNQNARDHTMAAAYSVRGVPDARASTPIRWEEVDDVDPHELTMATVPDRFAALGDLHGAINDHVFDLAPLLGWADRDEEVATDG